MLAVTDLRAAYGRIPILGGISLGVSGWRVCGRARSQRHGQDHAAQDADRGSPGHRRHACASTARISRSLRPMNERAWGIGYVPQGREIFPGLSVHREPAHGVRAAGPVRNRRSSPYSPSFRA